MLDSGGLDCAVEQLEVADPVDDPVGMDFAAKQAVLPYAVKDPGGMDLARGQGLRPARVLGESARVLQPGTVQREPPSTSTLESAMKDAAECAFAFKVGKALAQHAEGSAELEAAAAEATVASSHWEEQDLAR